MQINSRITVNRLWKLNRADCVGRTRLCERSCQRHQLGATNHLAGGRITCRITAVSRRLFRRTRASVDGGRVAAASAADVPTAGALSRRRQQRHASIGDGQDGCKRRQETVTMAVVVVRYICALNLIIRNNRSHDVIARRLHRQVREPQETSMREGRAKNSLTRAVGRRSALKSWS